jgi:trans-aconitate methyltransferase
MRDELQVKYESFYRDRIDPWDYWHSEYEIRKYHEQISLVAQFGTPKRILEIACSTGAHTKLIHEAFPDATITAVDISTTAIARASRNVDVPGAVSFHVADIFSFAETLEARSIDAIFWSEAFDFLHEHCTIAEFSRLARRLNASLAPSGILCISHVVPSPLSYPTIEAGQKNVRVFHELIRDYFHRAVSASNTLRKTEVDRTYRYDVKLYRPRLLDSPRTGRDDVCIDQVDVVIPARDEVQTVAGVISTIRQASRVDRVIVVDNGSVDGTAEAAAAAGAFVVRCPERGYGRAVKRGVQETGRQWVLKLDADIENAEADWVELLVDCATREKSRFAKTYWTASIEDPDRVTNFTVKPAFRIFFPELLSLHSPLSGIYLFDKCALDFRQLPNGFSFDVAMLISALKGAQTISQVEIEAIRHATIANGKRTYQHYYNMSEEVLRYIVEAGVERLQ